MNGDDIASSTDSINGVTLPPAHDHEAVKERVTGDSLMNGHGVGDDGIPLATKVNGHDTRCVTIAIVGAGQRGLVSFSGSEGFYDGDRADKGRGKAYATYALHYPALAKVVAVAEPRPHRRKVMSKAHA